MQASVPFGREYPLKVALPRLRMADRSSRMLLVSSGRKPITSIAFCGCGAEGR